MGLRNICSVFLQKKYLPQVELGKAVGKNPLEEMHLSSFHVLGRLYSKSYKLGFSSMWTENFQVYKLCFWRGRGTRDQIVNSCWVMGKAKEFQKNICFIDYTKAFDYVDHNKLENS